jgi:hypothetical protein
MVLNKAKTPISYILFYLKFIIKTYTVFIEIKEKD